MFTAFPTFDRYRTLRRTNPMMNGEDIFALQTALAYLGFDPKGTDGYFGGDTETASRAAQKSLKVVVDGLVGGGTQQAIAKAVTDKARAKYKLPEGLVFGQVMHESGCRLGNYSPKRPDGSYDAGVAQLNTEHTPAELGFTVPYACDRLGNLLRDAYDLFSGIRTQRRRWELATGCWNAPAYAKFIAREEGANVPRNQTAPPSDVSRVLLEQYMASATAYLVLP